MRAFLLGLTVLAVTLIQFPWLECRAGGQWTLTPLPGMHACPGAARHEGDSPRIAEVVPRDVGATPAEPRYGDHRLLFVQDAIVDVPSLRTPVPSTATTVVPCSATPAWVACLEDLRFPAPPAGADGNGLPDERFAILLL